jgi:hypothetical protein
VEDTAQHKCWKCGKAKPLTKEFFHVCKSNKTGFQTKCKKCASTYKEENKDKAKEYQTRYYLENKDRLREYFKVWASEHKPILQEYNKKRHVAKRDDKLLYAKEYRSEFPDKVRRSKKAAMLKLIQADPEYYSKVYEKHKDAYKNRARQYRARKLEAEGTHTKEDVLEILMAQQGKCAACGSHRSFN